MVDGGRNESADAVSHEVDRPIASGTGEPKACAGGGYKLSTWSRLLVVPFSMTALAISAYLAWSTLVHGSVAGCSADGVWDCSHVLSSPWSKCMGIPVSIPAMAIHVMLLTSVAVAYFGGSNRVGLIADRTLFLSACCAALAALWFIGLQVFVVGKLCKWCMVAHSAGIVACLLLAADYGSKRAGKIPLGPFAGALAMTLVLALAQVLGPKPETAVITVYDNSEPAGMDIMEMDFELIDKPAEEPRVGMDKPAVETKQTVRALSTETVFAENDTSEMHAEHSDLEVDEGMPVVATSTPEPAKDSNSVSEGRPQDQDNDTKLILADDADDTHPGTLEDGSVTTEETIIPTPTPLPDGPSPQVEKTVSENSAEAAPRAITFPGAKTQLKVTQWPLIGSPNARVIVAELFDYSCAHCRQMNRDLVIARSQFGDDLAVIALPVPLQANCNPTVRQTSPEHQEACELTNLALAVWRVNPAAFPDYHDWLCAAEPGRTAADARQEAERRVDPSAMRAELISTVPGQYIARHVAIYQRAGEGTLPKLLSDVMTVTGKMSSAQSLCDTLQAKHGLAPVIQ